MLLEVFRPLPYGGGRFSFIFVEKNGDTKVHDSNFIVEKLSAVLTNYLSNE